MEFVVITGMSGGGKSQAANFVEDAGYYCVDNIPARLIPLFAEIDGGASERAVAFVVDVRGESNFDNLFETIDKLKQRGHTCKTIFIECSNEVLINRYKETRRTHPLAVDEKIGIAAAVEKERAILESVKERSDIVIDTSKTTVSQLRERVYDALEQKGSNGFFISCMSFGFKYGGASEADLVFDVRCFPNPFYIPELKRLTGLDEKVRDYVFSGNDTHEFAKKLFDMLEFLIPLYIREGKHQITVAIGCTGGKHRSVAISEALRSHLSECGYMAVSYHRDINKE